MQSDNIIHLNIIIKLVEYFFSMKIHLFLKQTAQFYKSINLFCLVLLTPEFSLAVYFLQMMQYVSIVTYDPAIFI